MAVLLALTLAAAAPLEAPAPPALAAAIRGYDAAQLHGDRRALQRWLADDYLLVNSAGAYETKAQFVAESTAPGFKLKPFTAEQPVLKVWSDGAVNAGVATLRGTADGKSFETRLRFTDVWARRGGCWQVVYTQASKAP